MELVLISFVLSPELRASNELFHRKDDADAMSVSDINSVQVNSGILRLGASLRLDMCERKKSELHFKSQIFGEPSMSNMRNNISLCIDKRSRYLEFNKKH